MRFPNTNVVAQSFLATAIAATTLLASAAAQMQARFLHSFKGPEGAYPVSGLIADPSGNLYGTTAGGGRYGLGTVFQLSPTTGYHLLHSFQGTDGSDPQASLLLGPAGDLFGTTSDGGGPNSCGTAFRMNFKGGQWHFRVIHAFAQGGTDGCLPLASLIVDSAGNLYGTTPAGGPGGGEGTAFELTPGPNGWTETLLYTFSGGKDGLSPRASLVLDDLGNLYGTTIGGSQFNGCGNVFELSPQQDNTWVETVLISFDDYNGTEGCQSSAPLIFDKSGNLFGTTVNGGTDNDNGTVFELSPGPAGWTENVVYRFQGGEEDGAKPFSGLAIDDAGNLYGTTSRGGGNGCINQTGCGTAFQLTPGDNGQWTETVLARTGKGKYASDLTASVLRDSAGNLISSSLRGGKYGFGCIFELSPQ